MPFALELFFDPWADGYIRSIWKDLQVISGSDYMQRNGVRPHVALAVFEIENVDRVSGWRKALGGFSGTLSLHPSEISHFASGVILVSFQENKELQALHRSSLDFLTSVGAHVSAYYEEHSWLPHCTLAQGVEKDRMHGAIAQARTMLMFSPWQVASVGIVQFPPTVTVDEQECYSATPNNPSLISA